MKRTLAGRGLGWIVAGGLSLASAERAAAGSVGAAEVFQIESHTVHIDPLRREVSFSLTFSQKPDFYTLDEFSRPMESFQYEINPAFAGSLEIDGVGDIQTVVRGDEIHVAHAIRIRTALGEPDPDPVAGGWGQVRGVVPFKLDGCVLSFSASFDELKEDDGVFAYRLFSTEFGATTSFLEAVAIPLPPALGMGLVGLATAGAIIGWRSVRSRRLDARSPTAR